MKKMYALMTVLFLLLAGTGQATAVELKTEIIRPFGDNILFVDSEDGGMLTIEAFIDGVQLENPVTAMKIGPGSHEICWQGLTYGGEPLMRGRIILRATLAGTDRTVEQAETTAEIGSPLPAVVCCLTGSRSFYADGINILRIEVAMSAPGDCEISIAPKDQPEEKIWYTRKNVDAKAPEVFRWNGKNRNGEICPPGEYVISARSVRCPERVFSETVELLKEPQEEPELTVTGSLIPEDLTDDAEVWKRLTEPVAVGDGWEGQGLRINNEKNNQAGVAGTVSCRTVGLAVLETDDDGWVKVGAWTQSGGYYTEGYVKADKLTVIRPNTHYGAVLDKKAQTLTVYEDGVRLGTVKISTGLSTDSERKADTHSGVYLLGTRMQDFTRYGHTYCYPIRIDGSNLIHQVGYKRDNGQISFAEEISTLGSKASHGCVRVDARSMEENNGLNAWWIWTHMGHDTKIIITPED